MKVITDKLCASGRRCLITVTVAGIAIAASSVFFYGLYGILIAVPILLLAPGVYLIYRGRSARQHLDDLNDLYYATIASLAMAIDAKDQCTHGHVYRVQELALALAKYVKMTDAAELQGLRVAAFLHDIGKLAVPEYILNKPSPLTEGEMLKMKAHPTVGADILQTVPFPYPVVPFVRHHHERWNGTGYPAALKGEEIPLGARILAIADSYDALRSDRPYRPKLSRQLALDYMRSERGKSFDPHLIDFLLDHVESLEKLRQEVHRSSPSRVIQDFGEPFRPGEASDTRTVFQDIASTYREIQAIYEISETVGKSLNISETMEILAEKINELVPHEACAIFVVKPEQNRLFTQYASGRQVDLLESITVRVGEGVSGWVAANNQPLMNVSPSPDFVETGETAVDLLSCFSYPLSIDQRVIGVITLYSSAEIGFHHDQMRLMESVAHQAAVAINNAVVFEETQEDAYTDPLTHLPNLRYFTIFMEQELRRAARIDYPVTLLMMDLEGFKDVNDRYGHKVGDRMLTEIAQVLRNQTRRSDTIVRYAGDEFVAILVGTSKDQSRQTVERIQDAVDSFKMAVRHEQIVRVGISVGAACFPEDANDLETLLNMADTEMYRNKAMRAGERRGTGDVLPFEKR
jgi:diguanylate cyclase (GGDEF)-like protein/putative nucleotidyltransferase with HDIG domain